MRTAIVILNWNGRNWLERLIDVLLEHSAGTEVVVADNGSTDGSLEFLTTRSPLIRIISLGTNHGFADGYNLALAQVDADRFVLLNSDVEVTAGWLNGMHAMLDEHPRMAACQPKVRALSERTRFEHAGAAGGFIDRNGYPFCRGRIFEVTEEDQGQYDDDREIFWATGACMMIRREAFQAAGGFDGSLFAHMEEIDLCWRLRRLGWTIGYTSRSCVYHAGGGALQYGSPRKTYLNFRNSLIVLTKNLHRGHIAWWLPKRMVLDALAAFKFLFEGHGAHTWQVWRAQVHFLFRLRRTLTERRHLRRIETTPNLTGLYIRSIAYDRFILGVEKFSGLDPSAFVQSR